MCTDCLLLTLLNSFTSSNSFFVEILGFSIGLAKKFIYSFLYDGSSTAYLVLFNFIWNIVRLYCDNCHISMHLKKNLNKLVNFCVAILMFKMEEDTQHLQRIMFYYFKKDKMQKKKKDFCSVWRRCCDWSNISKVVCKLSWYYWLFGQVILCCGAVLCIRRYLAAPLASTH